MVDYNTAVILRKKGLSYESIAQHLNCSAEWCKRNLKDIPKGDAESYEVSYKLEILALIQELLEKVGKL